MACKLRCDQAVARGIRDVQALGHGAQAGDQTGRLRGGMTPGDTT
jgi:hypothetical protein